MLALLVARTRHVATLYAPASRDLEQLVLLEVGCAVLLLAAIGLGVRLALRPAHVLFEETAAALADHESRTRAVLDAMDEGTLLFARDGSLIDANPSAKRILGFVELAPGASMRVLAERLVTADGIPHPVESLPVSITLRTGEPMSARLLGVLRDGGEVRWLMVNTRPIRRDPSELPYACLSVFRDVTDERQLEEERAAQAQAQELQNHELLEQAEALERGQALFRSLVDTAGSAIVGVRMDGSLFEWNREAEALFGVPRADLGWGRLGARGPGAAQPRLAGEWRPRPAAYGDLEHHATARWRRGAGARSHRRRRRHHRARGVGRALPHPVRAIVRRAPPA